MVGYKIVNVWLLNGAFLIGGRYYSIDKVFATIGVHVEVSQSSREVIERLWDEDSTYGIPDYSDQFKVSIRRDI